MLTSVGADDDLVDVWRRESARAVRRFLDQALLPIDTLAATKLDLQLSARNQLPGVITHIHNGEVMSTVNAVLGDGQPVTAEAVFARLKKAQRSVLAVLEYTIAAIPEDYAPRPLMDRTAVARIMALPATHESVPAQ